MSICWFSHCKRRKIKVFLFVKSVWGWVGKAVGGIGLMKTCGQSKKDCVSCGQSKKDCVSRGQRIRTRDGRLEDKLGPRFQPTTKP